MNKKSLAKWAPEYQWLPFFSFSSHIWPFKHRSLGRCYPLGTQSLIRRFFSKTRHQAINSLSLPFDGEIGIFQENYVNTMTADALAPSVARPSAAMVWTMSYTRIFLLRNVCAISILRWGRQFKYSAVTLKRGKFSPKSSQQTPHSSPVRARYGVYVVILWCDSFSAILIAVPGVISW